MFTLNAEGKPNDESLQINTELFEQAIESYLEQAKKNVLLLIKPHKIWEIYQSLLAYHTAQEKTRQALYNQAKATYNFMPQLLSPLSQKTIQSHSTPKYDHSAQGILKDILEYLQIDLSATTTMIKTTKSYYKNISQIIK